MCEEEDDDDGEVLIVGKEEVDDGSVYINLKYDDVICELRANVFFLSFLSTSSSSSRLLPSFLAARWTSNDEGKRA